MGLAVSDAIPLPLGARFDSGYGEFCIIHHVKRNFSTRSKFLRCDGRVAELLSHFVKLWVRCHDAIFFTHWYRGSVIASKPAVLGSNRAFNFLLAFEF